MIVFDILFNEKGVPEHDAQLTQAMLKAGNVILADYLRKDTAPLFDTSGAQYGTLNIERVIPPLPAFEEACLTSAPFPLPKIPVRLNSYWAFKTEAGDLPTLPVAAFQAFARKLPVSTGKGLCRPVGRPWSIKNSCARPWGPSIGSFPGSPGRPIGCCPTSSRTE